MKFNFDCAGYTNYYRALLSSLSGEQLSLEISILLHIREVGDLLERCASHDQFEVMWELLVDEILARFLEQTFEPITC